MIKEFVYVSSSEIRNHLDVNASDNGKPELIARLIKRTS